MKRLKLTKGAILPAVALSFFLLWTSCTKSIIEEDTSLQNLVSPDVSTTLITNPEIPACKSQEYCLWANQNNNIGSATVSNDAENLYITERTVAKHMQNIFEKVKVSNRVELSTKLGA